MPERFAVIDTETTGLYSDNGDRIIEVGVVMLDNGRITDKFQSFINPGCPIPPFITDFTGITDEMVENAPNSKTVLAQAMRFVGDAPLVAHNASFDRRFINHELREIFPENEVDLLCTVLLSRRLFPNFGEYNLPSLVARLGIPASPAHRALGDAEMTAHLFILLREEFLKFSPHDVQFTADNIKKITDLYPKYFREHGIKSGISASIRSPAAYQAHRLQGIY